MEGYRLTARGKVLLGIILAMLAYGLFFLGSLMSQDVVSVVTDQIDHTTQVASSEEVPTEITEIQTSETTTEEATAVNLDTTVGKTDNCSTEISTTEAAVADTAQDLIKMATIIYFKPDRYTLDDQSLSELKPFIETALVYKDMPIVIEGHAGASNVATADDEALAKRRAESIKTYLISKKIAPSRILITSLVGTTDSTKSQQEIWKTMRAEIYFQGYAIEK